jgi:DNA mismatch repair ATPase MutS
VIQRAKEILGGLERDELSRGGRPTLSGAPGDPAANQLGLFAKPTDASLDTAPAVVEADLQVRLGGDNEIARRLRELDVDETTPRRALELLAELKQLADKD